MKSLGKNIIVAMLILAIGAVIAFAVHIATVSPDYEIKAAIGKVVVSPDKTYGDNQKGIRVSVYKEKLVSFDEPDGRDWVMAEKLNVMELVFFVDSRTEIEIDGERAFSKNLKDLDGSKELLVVAYYKGDEPANKIEVTFLK